MNSQNRSIETFTYITIWVVVILLYVLDIMHNRTLQFRSMEGWDICLRTIGSLGPYILLFVIHNYILIPRFLLHNRYGIYGILTLICILTVWMIQYVSFADEHPFYPILLPGESPYPRPLFPLPLIMDFIYALLIVGSNVAIALLFQRYEDRFEKEKLRKANIQSELSYLKSQINPHFYMNMLNNIHGMIEIDPEKAQSLVIDMARLMRYMLYDSSKPTISLSEEITFIKKYVDMMRLRYDPAKVDINVDFPEDSKTSGISLPPLLFIDFIVNAFKHGISYREESYVSIKMSIEDDRLDFFCQNRVHRQVPPTTGHSGIGLQNIRQRLYFIYKNDARLDVTTDTVSFKVTLNIPLYAIKNIDN